MTRHSGRAAFFDVDETLIHSKSMVEFLDFHLAGRGLAAGARGAVLDELRQPARYRTRAEANQAYYRLYRGESVESVAAAGRAWFARAGARPGFFDPDVRAALVGHARDGDLVVLVSGSFTACLAPIATTVGADAVLCTELEVAHGRYTGEVLGSMIGNGKAVAVDRFIGRHGLDAAACHAYGDHSSDLPMLLAVGHPVAVGADPVLATFARRYGWPTLSAPGRDVFQPADGRPRRTA